MAGDLELKVHFNEPNAHTDLRSFTVTQVKEDLTEVELYKFRHPVTGTNVGVTHYHRMNFDAHRWESAGHIEWSNAFVCSVWWGGMHKESIIDLRRRKKSSSKSRRFRTSSGAEYKWKIAENGEDLVCVSAQLSSLGKVVAEWSHEKLTLRVSEAVEPILDRIVVTWIINLWLKLNRSW